MAFGWINICGAREKLNDKEENHFNVVDVSGEPYPAFVSRSQLPSNDKKYSELQPTTQEFIKRLVTNIDIYFPKADNDQLIAMNLHPLFHWTGFK